MVKAAVLSLAVHGALVLALRSRPPSPPATRRAVEVEVVSRPRVQPSAPVIPRTPGGGGHGGNGGPRIASLARSRPTAVESPIPAAPNQVVVPEAKPNLFIPSALGHAAGLDLDAPAPSTFRPKHGVGSVDGRGGIGVGDFISEDAGRERARKGLVPPFVRDMERKLDRYFDPPFAHVDNANRKELMHKQFMGFLKTPPKTGELGRGLDPAKETAAEKLKSSGDRAWFLGRRVLVFARQRADGSIAELSIRQASGFHAFDDDAIDAVERALQARPPRAEELRSGEVRTLWQLDATGYVVLAPEPTLKFDESSGKSEWIYPLQKRVDKAVKLIAIY